MKITAGFSTTVKSMGGSDRRFLVHAGTSKMADHPRPPNTIPQELMKLLIAGKVFRKAQRSPTNLNERSLAPMPKPRALIVLFTSELVDARACYTRKTPTNRNTNLFLCLTMLAKKVMLVSLRRGELEHGTLAIKRPTQVRKSRERPIYIFICPGNTCRI